MATNNTCNFPFPTGIHQGHYLQSNGTNLVFFNPLQYSYMFDDFFAMNEGVWNNTASGSGAGILYSNSDIDSGHPGVWKMRTGTTASGTSTVGMTPYSNQGNLIFGGGEISLTWVMKLSAISDGTDTYTARIGFGSAQNADHAGGAYFEYTHSVNSGDWTMKTASNSTRTTANSSDTADANWHSYTVICNAGGSSVAFYIDGSECANSPITTNIPTTNDNNNRFTFSAMITKSAGTNERFMYLDAMQFYQSLTSAR